MSIEVKMGLNILIALSAVAGVSSWSLPYYPQSGAPGLRYPGFAPMPQPIMYRVPVPIRVAEVEDSQEREEEEPPRPQRYHSDADSDRGPGSYDQGPGGYDQGPGGYDREAEQGGGGPVHTFVKTDRHANYKWGVRHHAGGEHAPPRQP